MFRVVLIVFIGLLSSCGIPKTEHEEILTQNRKLAEEINALSEDIKKLNVEIEQYKNSPDNLVALIRQYSDGGNLAMARENIRTLAKYHPHKLEDVSVHSLISVVERKEREESKRKEAEEKERIRLANLNNTGMWQLGEFVDDFGNKTGNKYIINRTKIRGTFSNTATQNSPLNIDFVIKADEISIKLYEYAGNNPVKGIFSPCRYTVQIQDDNNKQHTFKAENWLERLSFNRTATRAIHGILSNGGNIKFVISNDRTPTTVYRFNIEKADWYENALRQLTGK